MVDVIKDGRDDAQGWSPLHSVLALPLDATGPSLDLKNFRIRRCCLFVFLDERA